MRNEGKPLYENTDWVITDCPNGFKGNIHIYNSGESGVPLPECWGVVAVDGLYAALIVALAREELSAGRLIKALEPAES